jgi:hypothetical protein
MATVFSDDFETDLSAWDVATMDLAAGEGLNSSQAARGDLVTERLTHNLVVSLTSIWCGFWFRPTGTSSSNVNLVNYLSDGSNLQSRIGYNNSTGNMWVSDQSGSAIDQAIVSIADGDFHFIEFFCFCDNSGQSIAHIDGVEVLNGSGDTRGTGGPPIDHVQFQGHTGINVRYFDDFYVDDTEFHGLPATLSTGRVSGMSVHHIDLATDAAGDGTAYSRSKVNGKVVRVFAEVNTLATTTDVVVTGERTAEAIYTGTNLTANTLADPTTAAGVYIWQERIKVVTAQGGDTKTGKLWFIVI